MNKETNERNVISSCRHNDLLVVQSMNNE